MENRSSKVIALVGLVAGIVGISLGFAAFSNTLTISSSADVHPDVSKFDVNFLDTTDATANPKVATKASYTIAGALTNNGGATGVEVTNFSADDATITNNAVTSGVAGVASIEDLKAHFTRPGQVVTYSFYARNDGEYDAYLVGVTFKNVANETSPIVCTIPATNHLDDSANSATNSLVQAACNRMKITVSVDGHAYSTYFADGTHALVNGSSSTMTNGNLARGAAEPVVVTIEYQAEEANQNQRPDGVMDVAFGDIELVYRSVNNS